MLPGRQFVVPYIRAQGVHVAIGSFGEENVEALMSGIPLIRKYLDKIFGPGKTDAGCTKAEEMIPDELIALWHPESRGQDPKTVRLRLRLRAHACARHP